MRIAVFDLYDGFPTENITNILDIVAQAPGVQTCDVFDVRSENRQYPQADYDVIISSGGPGDPREEEDWTREWDSYFQDIFSRPLRQQPFVYMICHSFQMTCKLLNIGTLNPAGAIFGMRHVEDRKDEDPYFSSLPASFSFIDARKFEVTIKREDIDISHSFLLPSTHLPGEHCLIASCFSPRCYGTQFHPEADPERAFKYFADDRRHLLEEYFGKAKVAQFYAQLENIWNISTTHASFLPRFLDMARQDQGKYD